MAYNYDEYLRTNKMPTLWCWGCGDGVILKSIVRAIEKVGWIMDDVCIRIQVVQVVFMKELKGLMKKDMIGCG